MTQVIDIDCLLSWFNVEKRYFPWRTTNSPYEILIAGILLRKTTAKQVASKYNDFIEAFPNPRSIHKTNIESLETHIKPLGIYRVRAKQMKSMANQLIEEYNGEIPSTYEELIKLPGISDYIASSVLCYAYGEQVAVVDTNILRIYRRLMGNPKLTYSEAKEIATENLPVKEFQAFNWALLDLAAKICRPSKPKCNECPIISGCQYMKNLS